MTPGAHSRYDAVILAGGSATRMGGVDKPAIVIAGRSMLSAALDAVAGAERVVVVGPHRADLADSIRQTQESPVGGGPVLAMNAGLRELEGGTAHVVVLAADLPFLAAASIESLVDALDREPDATAAFALDESGRVQFLLGVWRRSALSARLDKLGRADLANRPMKTVIPAGYVTVPMTGISDCDTEADVAAARTRSISPAVDLDEARRVVRDAVEMLPTRSAAPADALGGVLAKPMLAADALPRLDVSAMDGYAVSGDGPWQLDQAIRYAGSEEEVELEPGHAVRIATGAHVPSGATAVVRDEHIELADATLSRRPGAPVRDDTRRRGEDWHPGAPLAETGVLVTAAVASVALSGEVPELLVRGPVTAHVVVTGDEIRRDGPLRAGQTRDSLGPLMPHFLSWCGIRTAAESHLRDTAGGFDELLAPPRPVAPAADPDLIVIVGATGGGAADHLRLALARSGAHVVVGRVRCRPGGSQVVAVLPDGRVVLGLPGNPYAAVATLLMTAPTVVSALTGAPAPTPTYAPIENAAELAADVPRVVTATRSSDGRWHAAAPAGTAHLAALIGAHALAIIEPATPDGGSAELLPLPLSLPH
ncbi:NTP transferase domain-containing protein [Rhodococcus sp. NPDC058514]|uniref:NTP transferase domain-containing protein n=1 Tax=unclassified Rhodococcus (in: high G+C Gram-positive bacteria) TaxID=192944 RepID=UPI003659FCBA